MAEYSVVGMYETMAQAEAALHTLDQAGFPVTHLSIVTQNLAHDRTTHGYITSGNDLTPRGAVTGAWVGGLVRRLRFRRTSWRRRLLIPSRGKTSSAICSKSHGRCGTVVGRRALHGLQALLTSHVGDTLIRQSHGLTVWVVE